MSRKLINYIKTTSLTCKGCNKGIWQGTSYFSICRGYLDDLVTALDGDAETWHPECIDPYNLLLGIVPFESVAITLHQ